MTMRAQSAFSLLAAAIALGSCAQPEAPTTTRPIGLNRSVAELVATLPPGGTTTGVSYASIDLSCGGKTYTIKTGTDGGRCDVTTYDNPKHNVAICQDGTKGGGGANCTDGCVSSEGTGSCSVKTTR